MAKKAKKIDVARTIAKIQAEAQQKIDELADEYREAVVVPICRKYGLRFMTGNGTMFFVTSDDKDVYDVGDAEALGLDGLVPVLKALNTELDARNAFGYRVSDVDFGDAK